MKVEDVTSAVAKALLRVLRKLGSGYLIYAATCNLFFLQVNLPVAAVARQDVIISGSEIAPMQDFDG